MIIFSEKPDTPTLTSNNSEPTDGGELTFICTSPNTEVNSYIFTGPLGNNSKSFEAAVNSYTIANAYIDTHDGVYHCAALIDSVPSDPSPLLDVMCKLIIICLREGERGGVEKERYQVREIAKYRVDRARKEREGEREREREREKER